MTGGKIVKKHFYLFMTVVLALFMLAGLANQEVLAEEGKGEGPIYDPGLVRGGGGPMLGVLQLDLGDLNDTLEENNFGTLDETLLLTGGGGIGGFIDGSRFGGFGLMGTTTSSEGDKRAALEINYGGFLYEQGIYHREKFDMSLGALIGGGNLRLDLIAVSPNNFEDLVGDVANENSSSVTMEKNFGFLQPRLNAHYQVGDFVGLSGTLGYLIGYDLGSEWEVAGRGVSGGPFEELHGPSVDFRLNFGF